jgi:hypothetical protein
MLFIIISYAHVRSCVCACELLLFIMIRRNKSGIIIHNKSGVIIVNNKSGVPGLEAVGLRNEAVGKSDVPGLWE